MASYLAYRRAGGGNHERPAQNCAAVAQAISASQTAEMQQEVAQAVSSADEDGKLFGSKLQAILSGDRNPALAADPNLHYKAAVELQLLLEGLGT